MKFLTAQECLPLFARCGLDIERADGTLGRGERQKRGFKVRYTDKVNAYRLAADAVGWLDAPNWAVLQVTEYGIWPSTENNHLYSRLRLSYVDKRSLGEAPGHLFEAGERADAITFLQVAIANGWGGYLIGEQARGYVMFSHDEWLAFESDESLEKLEERAKSSELPYKLYSV